MTSVLISGAGVAGPALAFWLDRFGYDVTIVERAPALRSGGYAVDFRGAAVTVLQRMGLLDAVRAAETGQGDVTYVDGGGRRLATMPAAVMSGELEILRGDLVELLHGVTAPTVEYVFGDSIRDLAEDTDGVTVTFASGAEKRFDLVFGADGLHSTVRALAFGPEAQYLRPLGYYAAVITTENFLHLDHTGEFFNAPGRTIGMYSARNNTEAKALFYFASDPIDYDHHDPEQQKNILRSRFAGLPWHTERLVGELDAAADLYFDSLSQVKMPTFSTGRVSLVGDAGYCASSLSGMGTSLAIVGAYVLANELRAHGGNRVAAFAAYESELRDYIAACHKLADGTGQFFVPGSRLMIWLRNLNYRILPFVPWKKAIAAMPMKAANAITLKEYPEVSAALS
jgi:2-polyprenyl-6-methoxyphenol hydroxylase-like FAD-dependent oxidoreductase